MTPDTKRAAVERLAEFMGFEKSYTPLDFPQQWRMPSQHPSQSHRAEYPHRYAAWEPFSNLSDAFMVAEKIGPFVLFSPGSENVCDGCFKIKKWFCATTDQYGNLQRPDDWDGDPESDTAAEAICAGAIRWLDARRKEDAK